MTSSWGLPASRLNDTFESFDVDAAPKMRAAFEAVRAAVNGQCWCAFLYGGPGTGKTHLACAALNACSAPGLFWKVPDLLAWMRGYVSSGESWEVEKIIEGLSQDFLLVLDDYGAHNQTDWAEEQLYRIIDNRYEGRCPTIITSNVPLENIDARVRSRLREGFVTCEGSDYRARG